MKKTTLSWILHPPVARSLFLKLFLSFWTAMTLAGIVLLAIESQRSERSVQRWRSVTADAFAFYASSVAKDYENNPVAQSKEFLDDLEKRTGIRAWLFDNQDQEVSGHAPATRIAHAHWMSRQMRDLMARARQSGLTEFQPVGRTITLAARVAVAPSGHHYVLVGEYPAARYGPWQDEPPIQVLRLLAVLLTAGIVAWALSRHLTAPIETLRGVTQRLAAGDLTVRAGIGLASRRDELAQLAHDFDGMVERIESLMHEQERLVGAQRRLLRDVSHELRSPLARLGVALELARDRADEMSNGAMALAAPSLNGAATANGAGGDAADGAHHSTPMGEVLNRIEREGDRLSEMIDRLLVISRLESGVQTPDSTPIELDTMVRSIAADADFEARAGRRVVTVTECRECTTLGTRDLLRSAIENVIRNAARYTPADTAVEVSLQPDYGGRLTHDSVANGTASAQYAVVRVRDHGPGVPEAELKDVFQPFYRASGARERQSGGTGLGLAITARAVELHGGNVHAVNAPDGGLIVEIRLPLQRVHQQPDALQPGGSTDAGRS